MKISFLIATHNAQLTLPSLINKILYQATKYPIEIVISQDDGFKYSSILNSDKRIIYSESGLNSGPSNSRNRALKSSTGTHICLMDSDDDICDNYIKEIFYGLKFSNAVAIRTQYIENERVIREFKNSTISFKRLYDFYGSIHTVAPKEWTSKYADIVAEDVLATVNVIDLNGGSLPVVNAHYKLNLHLNSYCATKGVNFSNMYKDAIKNINLIVNDIGNPNLANKAKELYESRLKMSLLFDHEIIKNKNANYHHFIKNINKIE